MLPLWMYGFGETKRDYTDHLLEKKIPLDFDFSADVTHQVILKRVDLLTDVLEGRASIPSGQHIHNDILGHFLLRIVCAQDDFETDWFARREGYLFGKRFFTKLKSFSKKLQVVERFFGDAVQPINKFLENYPDVDRDLRDDLELKSRTRTQLVSIRWIYASYPVSKRECSLVDGWAIADINATRNFLRDWFEHDLRSKMKRLRTEFENTDDVMALADEVEEIIREKSGLIISSDDVADVMAKAPMCITDLDQFVSNGEAEYMENLQQTLFLLGVGLTGDDRIRYFYVRNPANKNKTWDEHRRDWIYQFEHVEGKRGSGTKYSPMACVKSRDEGYCPFRGGNTRALLRRLRDRHKDDPNKERVEQILKTIRKSVGKNPNRACTAEFALRFGVDPPRILTHPVKGYYRSACQLIDENKTEESETEKIESDPVDSTS